MDRARENGGHKTSELDGFSASRQATADRDGHGESAVKVDNRYSGVGY